jgi:type IX secretion system substrate protein
MKKITLLMAVLMWSSMFYAQTYLDQDFEGTFLPAGWVDEITPGTLATNNWAFSTVRANSGTRSAFFNDFNGDNDRWLITPVMNTSTGTSPELTYYENLDNSVDFGGVTGVYYSTDYTGGDPTAATWTNVNPTLGTDAEDIWTIRGPYALPVNATVYVAFRYTGNNKHDWWVDDVLVRETPTCVEPSAASFSSITTSSASFSWTPQGAETLWDVELVDITASGTPTGAPTASGVTNPHTFNALADGNKYEAYVRADCGGSTSAWAGPFAFTTKPSNDDCTQAQVVVHELEIATRDSATPTSGTINGATDSGLAPNGVCAPTGTANDDVWFAFVAKGPDVNITFDMGFDAVVELYSTTDDTCGTIAFLACADNAITGPAQEEIIVTGLTAGNTYYVRIFHWEATAAPDGDFTIKIWSSEALSNDEFDVENSFRYYPNPVNNELNLKAQNTIENVSVYNMLGQEVLRVAPNTNSSKIDMAALQTGAYFIRVTINGVTKTKQIIKR